MYGNSGYLAAFGNNAPQLVPLKNGSYFQDSKDHEANMGPT